MAWRQSQSRINGKGCDRKLIWHETDTNPMDVAYTNLYMASVSPWSEAREYCHTFVRNGLCLQQICWRKYFREEEKRKANGRLPGLPLCTWRAWTGEDKKWWILWSGGRSKRQSGRAARRESWEMVPGYSASVKMEKGMELVLSRMTRKTGVLAENRRSDRIIWMKVDPNGDIINIISAYRRKWVALIEIQEENKLWVGGDTMAIVEGTTMERNIAKLSWGKVRQTNVDHW